MEKKKTRKSFDDALTIISLVFFLALALNSFTSFNLNPWMTTIVMILAGAGLMFEGRVMTIKNWAKDGIQRPEIPYLFSLIFGLFTIIVGILSMPVMNVLTEQLKGIVGIVSLLCMAFISIERWVLN
jgi:hypothetical protein